MQCIFESSVCIRIQPALIQVCSRVLFCVPEVSWFESSGHLLCPAVKNCTHAVVQCELTALSWLYKCYFPFIFSALISSGEKLSNTRIQPRFQQGCNFYTLYGSTDIYTHTCLTLVFLLSINWKLRYIVYPWLTDLTSMWLQCLILVSTSAPKSIHSLP